MFKAIFQSVVQFKNVYLQVDRKGEKHFQVCGDTKICFETLIDLTFEYCTVHFRKCMRLRFKVIK